MGADARSRRLIRERVLVAGLRRGLVAGLTAAVITGTTAASVVSGAGGAQSAPDSPYEGRLAKALFLSENVGAALQALAADAPAPSGTLLAGAAARAAQPEPALAPGSAADPLAATRLAQIGRAHV